MSEPQLPEQPPGPATQPQPVPPQQRPPTGAPVSGPPGGELVHYPPNKRALLPTRDPKRRRLPLKTVLIIVAGVLAVLCLGGLGTGYFLYRGASEPERGTPGVAVRQYLQATFDDRDESRAALFTCGSPAQITEVQQILADIVSREQQFSIRITVSWENIAAEQTAKKASVDARLKVDVPEETGASSQSFQQWTFDTQERGGGWKVCGAHRTS